MERLLTLYKRSRKLKFAGNNEGYEAPASTDVEHLSIIKLKALLIFVVTF